MLERKGKEDERREETTGWPEDGLLKSKLGGRAEGMKKRLETNRILIKLGEEALAELMRLKEEAIGVIGELK